MRKTRSMFQAFKRNWKKKRFRIFVFLCIAIILVNIAASRYVTYIYNQYTMKGEFQNLSVNEDKETKKRRQKINEIMGWGFKFNSKNRHRVRVDGEEIFDVKVDIDEYGRRVVPVDNEEKRENFLMALGGSYVLGDSVNNNQTFMYHLADKLPEHYPYIYGGWWYTAAHMLARVKEFPLKKEIPQTKGTALVFFNAAHAQGIAGEFCYLVQGKNLHSPYFQVDSKGKLRQRGSFSDYWSLAYLIKNLLPNQLSQLIISHCRYDMATAKDRKYHGKEIILSVFEAIAREIKRSFQQANVLFVLLDFGSTIIDELAQGLEKRGLPYHLIAADKKYTDHFFQYYEHYNARGHELIAEDLYKVLKTKKMLKY